MKEVIHPPESFCNVDYCFSKEIYTHDLNKPCKIKYGLDYKTDTSECYTIHLWEQMTLKKHKIDVSKTKPDTLYNKLMVIVE